MSRRWGGRSVTNMRVLVAETYGLTCWLCGRPITSWQAFEVDHVLPRSRGGSDGLGNLRPAHGVYSRERCNQRKGAGMKPPRPVVDQSGWFA